MTPQNSDETSQSCVLDSPCHCERAALGSCLEKRSLGRSFLHNSPPSCTGLDLEAEDVDWLRFTLKRSGLLKRTHTYIYSKYIYFECVCYVEMDKRL